MEEMSDDELKFIWNRAAIFLNSVGVYARTKNVEVAPFIHIAAEFVVALFLSGAVPKESDRIDMLENMHERIFNVSHTLSDGPAFFVDSPKVEEDYNETSSTTKTKH